MKYALIQILKPAGFGGSALRKTFEWIETFDSLTAAESRRNEIESPGTVNKDWFIIIQVW